MTGTRRARNRSTGPVVRLIGDDAGVRAVAREAVVVLQGGATESPSDVFSRLWDLHRRRKTVVALTRDAAAHPSPTTTAQRREPSARTAYRLVWGALLTLGLAAALVLVVVFGPPGRKNRFLDPAVGAQVAVVAGVIAIVALVIVLVVRVPDRPSAYVGEVSAVLIGMLVVGILVYRLVVGTDDGRGIEAEDLSWWTPGALITALLLTGIVWRCDSVRRSESARPRTQRTARTGAREDVVRELRRMVESYASEAVGENARSEWNSRLETLARRGVSAKTLAQARTLTPIAWLAWLCYDGEIDIDGVLPRR